MPGGLCAACGLDHDRLGISIQSGLLIRRPRRRTHLLSVPECGPAWALSAWLVDRHFGEIEAIRVEDKNGAVYETDWTTFIRRSFRRDLGAGEQLILPLRDWRLA